MGVKKTMNKTINMIIPYFGKFPNYFHLFLKSCECNNSVNWTIITDNDENYNYPDNVQVYITSFYDLVQNIQSKFDFTISLDKPYKLCDYKPAYGYLFGEYLNGYDYWGYCDIDVIFGDLSKYLTPRVLSYSKIFTLGHFTLIKNEKLYNELFMKEYHGEKYYKRVYSNPDSYNFDEVFQNKININMIFEDNKIEIFDKVYMADIYTKSSFFRIVKNDIVEPLSSSFFVWDEGKLYRYVKKKNEIIQEEYMYIHLQKRRMKIKNRKNNIYKIIPNSFCDLERKEMSDLNRNFGKIKKWELNTHYFRLRFNNLKMKINKEKYN